MEKHKGKALSTLIDAQEAQIVSLQSKKNVLKSDTKSRFVFPQGAVPGAEYLSLREAPPHLTTIAFACSRIRYIHAIHPFCSKISIRISPSSS